jgi:hypothetical protein
VVAGDWVGGGGGWLHCAFRRDLAGGELGREWVAGRADGRGIGSQAVGGIDGRE